MVLFRFRGVRSGLGPGGNPASGPVQTRPDCGKKPRPRGRTPGAGRALAGVYRRAATTLPRPHLTAGRRAEVATAVRRPPASGPLVTAGASSGHQCDPAAGGS